MKITLQEIKDRAKHFPVPERLKVWPDDEMNMAAFLSVNREIEKNGVIWDTSVLEIARLQGKWLTVEASDYLYQKAMQMA